MSSSDSSYKIFSLIKTLINFSSLTANNNSSSFQFFALNGSPLRVIVHGTFNAKLMTSNEGYVEVISKI